MAKHRKNSSWRLRLSILQATPHDTNVRVALQDEIHAANRRRQISNEETEKLLKLLNRVTLRKRHRRSAVARKRYADGTGLKRFNTERRAAARRSKKHRR